jgi:hypothetical protein
MQITYSAVIAEVTGKAQKVTRVEDARGIDGLMTVVARRWRCEEPGQNLIKKQASVCDLTFILFY